MMIKIAAALQLISTTIMLLVLVVDMVDRDGHGGDTLICN
jgi:hypothetical protein